MHHRSRPAHAAVFDVRADAAVEAHYCVLSTHSQARRLERPVRWDVRASALYVGIRVSLQNKSLIYLNCTHLYRLLFCALPPAYPALCRALLRCALLVAPMAGAPAAVLCALLFANAAADTAPSGGLAMLLNPLDLDERALAVFEFFLIALIALFCLNFYQGARANLHRARAAADALDAALAAEFHQTGHAGGAGKRLVRDGAREYWYHASGRVRTPSLSIRFTFAPRHDLFARLRAIFAPLPAERVTLYAPLDTMPNMSVLLMRERELARWRAHADGVALAEARKLAGDVDTYGEFVAMAEHNDLVTGLFNMKVKKAFDKVAKHVVSLHLADTPMKWDGTCSQWEKLARVELVLPDSGAKDVIADAARLMCVVADEATVMKASGPARKKTGELRRKIKVQVEKEEMRKRREKTALEKEMARKEREERVAKMSRDKQIKHDSKARKQLYKDRLKKVRAG